MAFETMMISMDFKLKTMALPKKVSGLAFAFLSYLLLTCCLPVQKVHAQYDEANISYNDFYENLAPYGQWIEDPQYGYVWSPNEDGSFRPYYSNGHWVMTDYGNTWVSDYPWGWACFHYGRWTYDPYYGWLWIPGSNWGPAWVSWRYGEGYYGWAPLGPGYEFANAYGDYSCPNDWWVFIPPQYVYTGNYYRYWYGPRGNSHIINNTVFVNNTYVNNHVTYVSGPRGHDIESITHQPVQVYKLTNSTNLNTRVHHDVIKMYRPMEIRQAATINGQRSTPPNVVRAPQPVRTAQSVNTGQATPPQFRTRLQNNREETPGTNYNQTAEPQKPRPRNNTNPYEWDGNRPANQPEPNRAPEQQRQQQQQPQPQRSWGTQLPQHTEPQRQAPQPQPQRQAPAPAPQPQRQAPAPQPQRQAPAPTPQQREREGVRGR
jgi:hypothetical protein